MRNEVFRINNCAITGEWESRVYDFNTGIFTGEKMGLLYDNLAQLISVEKLFRGRIGCEDGAHIYFNGKRVAPYNSAAAFKEYVGVISGKVSRLFDNLAVMINIAVPMEESKTSFVDRKMIFNRVKTLFERYGVTIDPMEPVRNLSTFECKVLELLRAYIHGKKIVFLVNPTGFLSNMELERFMKITDEMAGQGMSVLVADNNIEFLRDYTDRITLFKDGRTIAVVESEEWAEGALTDYLYDASIPRGGYTPGEDFSEKDTVFQMRSVCTPWIRNGSFSVCEGEIATLLCEEGETYEHLKDLLFRGYKPETGSLLLKGKEYAPASVPDALSQKVCLVEEYPTESMLFRNQSIEMNCIINMLNKIPGTVVSRKYENSIRSELSGYFDTDDFSRPVGELEVCKQQKLVYCKWWLYSPALLVCFRPFSSIDFYMYETTCEMISKYARERKAVLVISTNKSDIYTLPSTNYMIHKRNIVKLDS